MTGTAPSRFRPPKLAPRRSHFRAGLQVSHKGYAPLTRSSTRPHTGEGRSGRKSKINKPLFSDRHSVTLHRHQPMERGSFCTCPGVFLWCFMSSFFYYCGSDPWLRRRLETGPRRVGDVLLAPVGYLLTAQAAFGVCVFSFFILSVSVQSADVPCTVLLG